MSISPEVARVCASIAATKRHHPDADTAELHRDLRAAVAADYIAKLVNAAPPLTGEQIERLRAILPAPSEDGGCGAVGTQRRPVRTAAAKTRRRQEAESALRVAQRADDGRPTGRWRRVRVDHGPNWARYA